MKRSMKFYPVDTDLLFEALNNDSVIGHRGPLLVSFIGAVEVVDGVDSEGGYETSLYLAGQLPTGPIIGVKEDMTVFALNNKHCLYDIKWSYYPLGFPEEQKTKRECPEAFKPKRVECAVYNGIENLDELPF